MSSVKRIEVLGPGCPRCERAYRVVRQVVEDAGLEVEVRKVDSIDRMVEMGILATPAVVVDGRVRVAGRVPEAGLVRELLGIVG